jgi:hypothetical protein
MKNLLFPFLVLLVFPLNAQQRISIIDKNDKNAALFDENNPYSLVNIVKQVPFSRFEPTSWSIMNRSYMTDKDREKATVSVDSTIVGLIGVDGEDSLIPVLDETGKPIIDESGNYLWQRLYESVYAIEYVDLSNISRLVLYEDWMQHAVTGESYYGIKTLGFAKKYPNEQKYDVVLKVPFEELCKMNGVQFLEKMDRKLIEDEMEFYESNTAYTDGASFDPTEQPITKQSFIKLLEDYQKNQFELAQNGKEFKNALYFGPSGSNGIYPIFSDFGEKAPFKDVYDIHRKMFGSVFYSKDSIPIYNYDESKYIMHDKRWKNNLSHPSDMFYWFENEIDLKFMDSTTNILKSITDPDEDSMILLLDENGRQVFDEFGNVIFQNMAETSVTTNFSRSFWVKENIIGNYYLVYSLIYDGEYESLSIVPSNLYFTTKIENKDVNVMQMKFNDLTPFHNSSGMFVFREKVKNQLNLTPITAWKDQFHQSRKDARQLVLGKKGSEWSSKQVKSFLKEFNADEIQFTSAPSGMTF